MSSDKHCCVPGCKESGGMHRVLHRFPNPERDRERFNTWLYTIGNCDILGLENEGIFKYRRVCHSHFEDKYLCRNNKISNIAVPTLNMPAPLSLKTFASAKRMPLQQILDLPSTSSVKMSAKLCKICLRSDIHMKSTIDERLSDFYNGLCEPNVLTNPMLTFCPLCEYKLRKFYNFKQKCLTAFNVLRKEETKLKHMNLKYLCQLVPPDSMGFSIPTDRRGFYNYEYEDNLFITDHQNHTGILIESISRNIVDDNFIDSENNTDGFSVDSLKTEAMIDADYIKAELYEIEDPILIKETVLGKMEFEEAVKINKFEDVILEIDEPEIDIDDLKVDVDNSKVIDDIDEFSDSNLGSDFDGFDDDCNSDDEKLSKFKSKNNKNIKKSNNNSKDKTKEKGFKQTPVKNKEKFTMKQLELLRNESFDLNDFSLEELKSLRGLLSLSDKRHIKFRQEMEDFKNCVVDLLEQGKIDLGENIKMTKDGFLEMFAKCDINSMKVHGIANQGTNAAKVKKFLLYLHKKFNPEYETVFKIDYLTTHAMKVAEFESRKESEEYVKAKYKCEKCYTPFKHKTKLDFHNKWHDPNRAHACDICPMRFSQRKLLKRHQINHYSVYRCKLCPLLTYYFEGMLNHYHQHKGRLYTCDICLGQYGSKSTLNGHRLSHARLSCEHCTRKFHSQQTLDKHKLKHNNEAASENEPTLSCDKCDAVFKSYVVRRRHMKTHNVDTPFFKCRFSTCLKRFSSASELREHALTSGHVRRPKESVSGKSRVNKVPGDKPYRTCPVCGEQVSKSISKSLYKHHMRCHPTAPYHFESEYTTLCEHCGKAFVHHSIYLDHLNTHAGVKPYECKDCGARYSMRRSLYTHSERHRAPRQCKECGKKFRSFANLFAHRRTHIGDRKFKCEVCNKGFLHSGALKEHINGVHNQVRRDKRRARKQTDKQT